MSLLSRLKPAFWDHPAPAGMEHLSYRRMWKINFTVAVVVTLLPLFMLAALTVYQVHRMGQLTLHEAQGNLESTLRYGAHRLELCLRHTAGALQLAGGLNSGDGDSIQAIALLSRLEAVLEGLRGVFRLDRRGRVVDAAGEPPALEAKRARKLLADLSRGNGFASGVLPAREVGSQNWCIVVLVPGAQGTSWGALLDMEHLQSLLAALPTDPRLKMFLLERGRRLRLLAGELPAPFDFLRRGPLPAAEATGAIQHWQAEGRECLVGLAPVEGSPLELAALLPLGRPDASWRVTRYHLLVLVGLSLLLMLAVIFKGTRDQVERLYRAHLQQAQVLREIVYTHKMASIGRLASGVAHQINNPLAVVNEKAGLMKDLLTMSPEPPSRDRLLQLVDSILHEVKRASSTTHRLLGFARQLPVEPSQVELDQVVREVAGFFSSETSHRSLRLELDLPPGGCTIQSDKGLLEQALFNIVNNAANAVGPGGRITISLREQPDGWVRLEVSDDGPGIAPEHLKHIFEPFFTTSGKLGTGLGLSITYGIVQKLGGRIEAESRLGQGTTFRLLLPHGKQDAPTGGHSEPGDERPRPAGRDHPAPPQPADDRPRVLLVDDEEEYVEIVAERLRQRGFRVAAAYSAHEALERLARDQYDAVVLDMMMPVLGGMEALKRIRAEHPSVAVIVQTGLATQERQETAARLGAAALMEKPVDIQLLSRKLEEVCRASGRKRPQDGSQG